MKDLELSDLEEARQALKDEELLDRLLGNLMF
jgi:hypothetical protein